MLLLVIAALAGAATDRAWAGIPPGQYVYEQSTDQISGRDRSQVSTTELDREGPGSARMVWRCDGPELGIQVLANRFLTNGSAGVEWRFDRGTPSPYTLWPALQQGTGVSAPSAIVPFLTDHAKAGQTVRIRLWDDRGVPDAFEFSLDGLPAALERLDCSAPSVIEMTALDPSRNVLWMYGAAGTAEAAATLQWKCEGGELSTEVIETGSPLSEVVGIDFDGESVTGEYWSQHTLAGPRGALLERFLARLAVSDSLGLRLRSQGSDEIPVRFDVPGFRQAYGALGCGGDLRFQNVLPGQTIESTRSSTVRESPNHIVPSGLWDSAVAEVSDPALGELHDLFFNLAVVRGSSLLQDHAELALLVQSIEAELEERDIGFLPISLRVKDDSSRETVYDVGDGVDAPTILSRSEPEYTDQARAAGVEGTVVLEVVIRKDGSVDVAKVIESLDPGLDDNAIAAVTGWVFRPASRGGEPVNVRARVEIRFSLH